MKFFNLFKKKTPSKNKILIIILTVLIIIGFTLSIYFRIEMINLKKEFSEIGPQEKLEKINSYAVVLEKFEEFKRKEGESDTSAELEKAVLATNSGVLKTLFNEMILGGNLDKDMRYFLDAVIDSLKFFSR